MYDFTITQTLGLALVLFKSIQCDRRKSVIIFISGKFSEMGEGTNKRTDLQRLWHQSLMHVGAYFEQEMQSSIYSYQADSLR